MKKKMKILITSGPTRGPIDAVRYITNKSSGRLGTEIAKEALKYDADVTFIYGKGSIIPKLEDIGEQLYSHLKIIEILTVDDLIKSINQELKYENYDAVIHSMAVLDYVPDKYIDDKVDSGKDEWIIRLIKTPKVIKMIRDINPKTFLTGFKLEFDKPEEELVKIAYETLLKIDADLMVANNLRDLEKGEHIAYFVDKEGKVIDVQTGKRNIAKKLIKLIVNKLSI
jgi:phosphopantothenoylcysteine synthetase/decarboxylase